MDFKTDLWDEAENDFRKWLSSTETNSNELTGILQATFLLYRKKLRENLSRVHDNSLQFLAKKGFVREPDFLYDRSSQIMFDLAGPRDKEEAERWKREEKEQNLKENTQIVNALLLGNQSTVNKLYEWEFPKIVRLILKNSGNLENAKDVFQDGLVVLVENVLNKKIDLTESFSSYLYGVCRILWLNQLKKRKKAIQFKDEYSHFQTDFVFVDIENQPANYENIFAIIESMGNPCKKLLESYYYRNMDWETISEELGYASPGSARTQKYKCLERIRKQMAEINEL